MNPFISKNFKTKNYSNNLKWTYKYNIQSNKK